MTRFERLRESMREAADTIAKDHPEGLCADEDCNCDAASLSRAYIFLDEYAKWLERECNVWRARHREEMDCADKAENRVAELESAIAEAPHASGCETECMLFAHTCERGRSHMKCNCWKAEAEDP